MFSKPEDYPRWFRGVVIVTLTLLVINLFFFIAPLTAFIGQTTISARDLLVGIGTLIATFAGAWLAFGFAQRQRSVERRDQEIAAGNLALFTLSQMLNHVTQYKLEVIDPFQKGVRRDAWINLHVGPPLQRTELSMSELSFLLKGKAGVFQQVALEGVRFQYAAYLIEEHRKIAQLAWERLAAAGIPRGVPEPHQGAFKAAVGFVHVQMLETTTASLLYCMTENVDSFRQTFQLVRKTLIKIYPEAEFIQIGR